MVQVRRRHRIGAVGSTGVVHQQVTTLADLGREQGNVVNRRHIAHHSPAPDLGSQGGYPVAAPRRAHHLEPVGGKSTRGRGTYAAARSGDDRNGSRFISLRSSCLSHPLSIVADGST